jgi:hypothetical protein
MKPGWSTLLFLAALGCAGSGSGKEISVGGTYQTAVTVLESTCADMGVQQHPTTVAHQPGDSLLTVTHAGASYQGTLRPDGRFTTRPGTFAIYNVTYTIRLTGSFAPQAVDIRADVEAGRQPPCHIAARWSGPKDGPPNVLP